MKIITIKEPLNHVANGKGNKFYINVFDNRIKGAWGVQHNLFFDTFDESCLLYIIERRGPEFFGQFNKGTILVEQLEGRDFIKVQIDATIDETGVKIPITVCHLPIDYGRLDTNDNWFIPAKNLYKEFCASNKNWKYKEIKLNVTRFKAVCPKTKSTKNKKKTC